MRPIVAIIFLLCLEILLSLTPNFTTTAESTPDVYVGVDMTYGDSVEEAKRIVDEVAPYTNLFVLGCKGITYNTTRLNQAAQYIVDKGLNFIVYRDTSLRNATWTEMANQKWPNNFLGYYAFDELGGWQIDMHEWRMVMQATDYQNASTSFVNMANWYLDRFARFRNTSQFNLYTADYALYWFDYQAGYDTVFAELGWNYSRQLNIALCRGAATMHQKDWGTIITWTYTKPPYIESGQELYKDLILAYNNGAKYIIVFDGNEGWTQSILKQEHFNALKQFWNYIKENPRQTTSTSDRAAYVLPKDYGYGFRGPNDKIWGFWQADNQTSKICNDINTLLETYNEKLDIIYDTGLHEGDTAGYNKLYYWHQQIPQTQPQPTPSPGQTPNQTQNPTATDKTQTSTDYTPILLIGAVIASIVIPAILLRKQQILVRFETAGIGPDYKGTVITIDEKDYDKYGASFWWQEGSHHKYEYKQKLTGHNSKQYILTSISNGQIMEANGTIKINKTDTTITGNYKPAYTTKK